MRKTLVVAATALLVGCGGGVHRELDRYYDPGGLFSAELPRDHLVQVLAPQPEGEDPAGPRLLGGVQSVPAPPSPSASDFSAFGNLGAGTEGDQTAFYVFALSSSSMGTAEELATVYTSQPGVDVRIREPVRVGPSTGLLVVADTQTETGGFSVASAFVVEGDLGFWIAAAFPVGGWQGERDGFLKVLSSFRSEVPPAIGSIPLGGV